MDVLGQDRREGLGRKSDGRIGLNLLILVSLFLLLSSLYAAEASVFRKAREGAIEAAYPFLSVFAAPIAWIEDRVGSVRDYFNVLEQNKALREENADLRQWMNELDALREVVGRYQGLGVYATPAEAKPIIGFVVGESNDAFVHSMIVNAGAGDGVKRGQAVIDDQGLVGRIVDVSENAARVLLLDDVQSRIPVFVEESFVDGIMIGRNSGRPTLSFTRLDDIDRVKPGQKVWTSGAGGVLPRGMEVGVIDEVRGDTARIRLSANYARTRMVRVVNYAFVSEAPADDETPDEAAASADVAGPALGDVPAAPPPPPEPTEGGD